MGPLHKKQRLKKKRRQSPTRRRSSSSSKKHSSQKRREKALHSIYHGSDGRVPNMKKFERKKARLPQLIFLTIVLIGLVIGGQYLYENRAALLPIPPEGEASISIDAPQTATITQDFTLSIAVAAPQNPQATLSLFLPEGFVLEQSVPEHTGSPSERERTWELSGEDLSGAAPLSIHGRFLGDLGDEKSFRAVLSYQPDNFDSTFQVNTLHTVRISDTPLAMKISGPERFKSGESATFSVELINTGSFPLERITLLPPSANSFEITTPDDDRILNKLGSGEEHTFDITGSFRAGSSGVITLLWQVIITADNTSYVIGSKTNSVALTQQPLVLTIDLDEFQDGISPGQTLRGTVRYHNKSQETFEDASLVLSIDAPSIAEKSIINYSAAQTTGSPDIEGQQLTNAVRRGVISWDSEQLPTLEEIQPNQTGVLSFSLPLQGSEDIDVTKITADTIELSADFLSGEEVISAQPITVPLLADTSISAGAIKAGDTIVVAWTIEHHFHDLDDVVISATLFGDVLWLDQTDTSSGNLSYEDGTVQWHLDSLEAESGNATATFAVQLEDIDPTQTTLLGHTSLEAADVTVGATIKRTAASVSMP